jgi:hypothetical protein
LIDAAPCSRHRQLSELRGGTAEGKRGDSAPVERPSKSVSDAGEPALIQGADVAVGARFDASNVSAEAE